LEAKKNLEYPAVRFTPEQIQSVARGFEDIRAKLNLVLYAVALMPDHVHIVVPRQRYEAEELCGIYKRAASRQLKKDGCHPLKAYAVQDGTLPTPWAEYGWKVFLHDPDEIWPAIKYAERNPVVAGLPAQRWEFVTPYEGG
jgi:REP element-mobilizing transposase RayT